ncbi:hypothetical protein AGABI2DRAFT_207819, partial [Agaricus bisporus var. bisporus H97]|uniref:hypothetical protein n=1 Tax=Agaricus bisporus var. bisporus (strain H97 / ATCC MYA-4626 / FGSC 10389) TaxID=936046 RepID=UPI00029F769E
MDVNSATASRSLASGHPIDPQNTTGHFQEDGALESCGQTSQALDALTHTDVVGSKSTKTHSPHISVAPQPAHLPCPPAPTDSQQTLVLAPQHSPYSLTTPSQHCVNSSQLTQPQGQYSSQPQPHLTGLFNQARDFTVTGTFIEGNVTYNNTTSNQFMEKLLEKTILGAASDSSARDPPPRCHPGTRLAILERCLHFIANCNDNKKIRWVVGSAGVGKSAILQNVAESPKLPVISQASVFFSINGRNDGSKAILTLSYQLATKSELYRQVIEYEIARDPSLLQSSLSVHFKKFIVEPFIGNSRLNSAGRILIIIDGLDECHNLRSQQEILRLIFDLCITYPSSPIVWLIASRPEQHITSFFSRANVTPTYEKEEVAVDSDEARADVERFLRDEMKEIKASWYSLDAQSEWPDERDLWKLANASGGLFAYAHTAIKYIGDPNIGNPVSQLSDVLNVIDNHPMTGIPRDEHPMALLDALYARILSNVPPKIMVY